MMHRALTTIALLVAMSMPSPQSPAAEHARIIVQFTPQAQERVGDPRYLEELSDTIGYPLELLHANRGGLTVFEVSGFQRAEELSAILSQLAERDDIRYAEPDLLFRPTSPSPIPRNR